MSSSAAPLPPASRRRYVAPVLRELGSMVDLTRGPVSGPNPDGASGMTMI